MRKNELMSIGYELVDETENSNISNDEKVSQTDDSINETSENEISQDANTSEEQSEDSVDETEENLVATVVSIVPWSKVTFEPFSA